MKPILTLIILFSISLRSFACWCIEPIDKEGVQKLINDVDLIFYGSATTSIYLEQELTKFYNNRNNGYNVIMKIDSVIKGDLNVGDEVLIYQNSGDCDELFNYGEQKLILGNTITKFKTSPTLEIDFNEGVVLDHQSEKETKFYNQAIESKTGIWTNSCNVYTPNSKIYLRLLDWMN
ncbi:MAG: hypothetical protein ABJH05_05620 [Fulvivirga sp.]